MDMLEQKLENVVRKYSTMIEERELKEDELYDFVFKLLKEDGLLTKRDPYTVGKMTAKLEHKTGTRLGFGIKHDYCFTQKTKISSLAIDDMQKYDKLVSSVELYLAKNAENGRIEREKFGFLIVEYVERNADVSGASDAYRLYGLMGSIKAKLERKFEIIESAQMIGQYNEDEIDKILKKIR